MKKNKTTKAKPAERVVNVSPDSYIYRVCGRITEEPTTKQQQARQQFARGVPLKAIIENLGISVDDLFTACQLSISENLTEYKELLAHAKRFAKYGNPLMESERTHEAP